MPAKQSWMGVLSIAGTGFLHYDECRCDLSNTTPNFTPNGLTSQRWGVFLYEVSDGHTLSYGHISQTLKELPVHSIQTFPAVFLPSFYSAVTLHSEVHDSLLNMTGEAFQPKFLSGKRGFFDEWKPEWTQSERFTSSQITSRRKK